MKTKAGLYVCLTLPLMLGVIGQQRAYAQILNKKQSCEGIVAIDEDGMLLLKVVRSSASSPWCDAYIGESPTSPPAKEVLATCPVNSQCRIVGLFSGRGVFYWTKILSAVRR